jgi:O-acetylserine/cysteine efflux transporter
VAIDGHIAPGLASLVVQIQAFFTVGLAIWLTGERLRGVQWLAAHQSADGSWDEPEFTGTGFPKVFYLK